MVDPTYAPTAIQRAAARHLADSRADCDAEFGADHQHDPVECARILARMSEEPYSPNPGYPDNGDGRRAKDRDSQFQGNKTAGADGSWDVGYDDGVDDALHGHDKASLQDRTQLSGDFDLSYWSGYDKGYSEQQAGVVSDDHPSKTSRRKTAADHIECFNCSAYGTFACRETVGDCDLCGQYGDVLMDYSHSGDRERPDETVCLDCLISGKHLKAAHTPEGEAFVKDLGITTARRKTAELVSCTYCAGTGKVSNGAPGMDLGPGFPEFLPCSICDGKGEVAKSKNQSKPYTMSAKTAADAPIPKGAEARDFFIEQTVAQIGKMNILSISGGRVVPILSGSRTVGLSLPVSQGYAVNVYLMPDDTYTVQRVYRGAVKGEQVEVYAEEVGEVCYQAGMYVSNDFGGHKVGRKTAGAFEDGQAAYAEGKARVVPSGVANWGGQPGDTDLSPIQEWYRGWDAANLAAPVTASKIAMPSPESLNVKVGDIFVASWGYDQTNVDFYEVTGLTGASVRVREVAKDIDTKHSDRYGSDYVTPRKGNFIGGEMTKRLQAGYQGTAAITINTVQSASLWDGTPEYETSSGWGH